MDPQSTTSAVKQYFPEGEKLVKNIRILLIPLFCLAPCLVAMAAKDTWDWLPKKTLIPLMAALDQYDWEAFEKEFKQFDPAVQKRVRNEILLRGHVNLCANQATKQPDEQQQPCKNGFAFFSSFIDRYPTDIKPTLASALSSAARTGNVELIEFLIDKGAPVDPGDNGPLLAAVKAGNSPAIDLLLSRGANVNKPREEGTDRIYPIFQAMESPAPLETIKHLIKNGAKLNVLLNAWYNTQFTLLDAAIVGKNESVALFFIEKGLKLHERVGQFLLVHEAAMRGMTNVLQAFIKKHIPITVKDEIGNTALHKFCKLHRLTDSKKAEEIVTILVNSGIDINDQNNDGKTAIDLALERRDSTDDNDPWDAIIKQMEKLAKKRQNNNGKE
jgi:ankyrin repeat protein